jgi:acyl-CoA thioester hydrolase
MAAKTHRTSVKVRYAETDNMGIVYYANYLVWFEVGRTEYLLAQGIDYRDVEKEGLCMAVVAAHAVYKAPARYGETLWIETTPRDVRNSSLAFDYRVVRESDRRTLCTGFTTHVLVDRRMKPHKIPEKLREVLT